MRPQRLGNREAAQDAPPYAAADFVQARAEELTQAYMTHDEYVRETRRRILRAAEAMLDGRLSFIEGARRINLLRLDAEFAHTDPDLQPFIAIDSETDNLPIGEDRKFWTPDALAKLQPDIDYSEDWARENSYLACRKLVERLSVTDKN
jgi:hypothetical protein